MRAKGDLDSITESAQADWNRVRAGGPCLCRPSDRQLDEPERSALLPMAAIARVVAGLVVLAFTVDLVSASVLGGALSPTLLAGSSRRVPKPGASFKVRAVWTRPHDRHSMLVAGLILSAIEDVKQHRLCRSGSAMRDHRSQIAESVRLWVADQNRLHPDISAGRLYDLGERLIEAFDAMMFSSPLPPRQEFDLHAPPTFLKVTFSSDVRLALPKAVNHALDRFLDAWQSKFRKAHLEFGEYLTRNDVYALLTRVLPFVKPGEAGFVASILNSRLSRMELEKRCHRLKVRWQLRRQIIDEFTTPRLGFTYGQIAAIAEKSLMVEDQTELLVKGVISRISDLEMEPLLCQQAIEVLLSGYRPAFHKDRRLEPPLNLYVILGSSLPEVIVLRLVLIAVLRHPTFR